MGWTAATGRIEDKAVGEDIDVDLGAAGVVRVTALPASGKLQRWRISNSQRWPVRFEGSWAGRAGVRPQGARVVTQRDGRTVWQAQVPARGSIVLSAQAGLPQPGQPD